MTRDELLSWLRSKRACDAAITWISSQADAAPAELWDRCERGDWLLWVAARAGVDRRAIVSAACDCAEPALVHVPAGEDRPRLAIEAARAWAADPTEERAHAARAAADDAADEAAAYYATAAAAANASAYSASAARADAAYAADAASAAAAASSSARSRSLAESARLVRARISWQMIQDAIAKERDQQ